MTDGMLLFGALCKNTRNLARLSPLLHQHINVLGRYALALADPVAQGKLRPLNLEGWDAEA